MDARFEFITNLQYKVKSLGARVRAFESGEKDAAMEAAFGARLAEKDREIRKLKAELAGANAQLATMRENWSQVFEDLEAEHGKELGKKDREIRAMEERALKAESRLDIAKAELREKRRAMYEAQTELEEERGRNQKLTAQINRDYENSSIPSSLKPNHKKIHNSREKTGRKPGGQPGREGRARRRHEPTRRIEIPAPEQCAGSPDYRPTGRMIVRQLVGAGLSVAVDEYSTPEFRHVRTGLRVHADFPEGVDNDADYAGSVKSLAFLLNNGCNVPIEKVSDLISDLTGGALRISAGMINGLAKELSQKTEADQRKAFASLLLAPVMNVDFTSARVNEKNMNVFVCATLAAAMYFAREHKGHEGVKGTPAEDYQHTLVHDHDTTFGSYGRFHQECLEHVLRYLLGSMENEPGLKWSGLMRELIREMIHFWNGLDPGGPNPDAADPERVEGFEARYDEILGIAEKEYEYEPPTEYYVDGINLFKRMRKHKDRHLLFLHDIRVPPTNNLAERLLRVFKRKQAQAMAFRSFESLAHLCQCMGIVASLRARGQNLFESVAAIFDRPPDGGAGVAG
jgi:hypothetical protein